MTAEPQARQARLEEVADGVLAYIQPDGGWCLNNAGLVLDSGEAALIDTAATESRTRLLRAAALGANGGRAPARSSTPTSTATTPSATTSFPRPWSSATNAPAPRWTRPGSI